jgi:hypothetical protein
MMDLPHDPLRIAIGWLLVDAHGPLAMIVAAIVLYLISRSLRLR